MHETTVDFLRSVLPEDGIKYVVVIPKNGLPIHHPYTSFEDMAEAAIKFDQAQSSQVYFACASFKKEFVLGENGKKLWRVPQNHHLAKAFWLDIDCGEEKASKGDGYATKKEAAQALKNFCSALDLPIPTIVDSGNGIHTYWKLAKAIPEDKWRVVANALKAASANENFLTDAGCTADFSRILRPIGVTNKKSEPKKVKLVFAGSEIEPKVFAEKVSTYIKNNKVNIKPAKPTLDANADLIAHAYPETLADANIIVEKCNQFKIFKNNESYDGKKDISYQHWFFGIGLLKFCHDGLKLAHEWSAQSESYEPSNTQAKYDTWSTGPSTCEAFRGINPKGCEGCMFKDKITTPKQLGVEAPEPQKQEVEAVVNGNEITVEIPELPKGFGHDVNGLVQYQKNEEGIVTAKLFCKTIFYPIYRVCKENEQYSLYLRMHLPDKRVREFELDTEVLASAQKTCDGLARYEIVASNVKDANATMNAYLKESLEKLKQEAEEINTHTSFGWNADFSGFLIGDRLYTKGGGVKKVLLGGYARDKADHFPAPVGTTEGYAQAIQELYGQKGMEPMQYVICSAFGSLLTPLCDAMYRGLLLAITGEDTAKGKTTVCWSALYAFGDASKMSIDNATYNAKYARLGVYKNIPVLFDEVTNIESADLSQLAYTIANGKEKERLTSSRGGVRFAEAMPWWLSPFATANKDLHSLLAAQQSNTQAEAVRMIQIKIDQYDLPRMKASHVEILKRKMQLNMGSAGEDFIKYTVDNLNEVTDLMGKWAEKFEQRMPDIKYRFYRSHGVCTLTSCQIANKLGVTNFDTDVLFEFAIDLFEKLAATVLEQNTVTAEDALSRMLNDLSPRIISSYEYRDGRDSRGPESVNRINGSVAGRYILGNSTTKDNPLSGKLYLVKKEISDWCLKHRVDPKSIVDEAMKRGFAHETKEKFNIGRGTTIAAGQHRCLVIDIAHMESSGIGPKLTVHTGGKLQGDKVATDDV